MKNLILALTLLAGCATTNQPGPPRPRQNKLDPTPAVVLLQAGRFDEADAKAREIVTGDPLNSQANVVVAFAAYKRTMHQVVQDFFAVAAGIDHPPHQVNYQYVTFALTSAAEGLASVEKVLATAGSDSSFGLELCLACWQYDWNHNGRVDFNDKELFQIEIDGEGNPIPSDDPRRKPTFHFDIGDIHWARAMVLFQHAAANLLLAYDFSDLDKLIRMDNGGEQPDSLRLRLRDKARVQQAKSLILDGLAAAALARQLYLAETDDVGEWVANPRQKDHPLPLPVDEALYETWAQVLADVRELVEGKAGFNIADLAQLGDHHWANPPKGYLNVATLLDQPSDMVFHVPDLIALAKAHDEPTALIEKILGQLFGASYQPSMKASLLPSRFHRMKEDIEQGHESLERKLRYLLWLN